MENFNIYKQSPSSIRNKILFSIITAVVIYLLIAGTTMNITVLTVVTLACILVLGYLGESRFYDGLVIDHKSIIIAKNSFFQGRIEHKIDLKDIKTVTYFKGAPKIPQHILIESERKPSKAYVTITENIFKFAYRLREMKRNKIEVKLNYFDHEVQLFLDERISELPMTSDMKIR